MPRLLHELLANSPKPKKWSISCQRGNRAGVRHEVSQGGSRRGAEGGKGPRLAATPEPRQDPNPRAGGSHGRAPPSRGAPASGMETARKVEGLGRGARDPRPGRLVLGLLATTSTSSGAAWARAPSAGSQADREAAHPGREVAAAVPASGGPPTPDAHGAAGTPALRRPRGSAVPGRGFTQL